MTVPDQLSDTMPVSASFYRYKHMVMVYNTGLHLALIWWTSTAGPVCYYLHQWHPWQLGTHLAILEQIRPKRDARV